SRGRRVSGHARLRPLSPDRRHAVRRSGHRRGARVDHGDRPASAHHPGCRRQSPRRASPMNLSDLAFLPGETLRLLTARTPANSHPTLDRLLCRGRSGLDVGCGPGTLTREIAQRVDPGAVVGMDVNPAMIRTSEEAIPQGALRNLIFYTGDIRESAWDSEFDV